MIKSLCAACVATVLAHPVLADAKWVRVDEPAPEPASPTVQILQFFFGAPEAPAPGPRVVTRSVPYAEVPWVYQPTDRKLVYGLPVISGTPGVRRGGYLVGPDWTPYSGYAVRTNNGVAVTRPQRSVSGSLGASRVGRKISRRLN